MVSSACPSQKQGDDCHHMSVVLTGSRNPAYVILARLFDIFERPIYVFEIWVFLLRSATCGNCPIARLYKSLVDTRGDGSASHSDAMTDGSMMD